MYSELIEVAGRTLAQNQRVRAHADELRVRTNTLILTYRVHRFRPISGASDAGEDDRVRRLLRECFAGTQKPKSYVGYSRGSVCQACGGVIKPAEIEYDVADGTAELRLDAACYALFSEAWGDRAASDAPAATDD